MANAFQSDAFQDDAFQESGAPPETEVSATPIQTLSDGFGPALAARLNGVLQQ